MLLEIHEILCLSQLSAGGAISFQVFLLDQTATSLPDLFHALSDLKYITDQPGPRGRAFRLGASARDKKLPWKSSPDCELRRRVSTYVPFLLSFILPPENRSILSFVCSSAMSGLT